MRRARIKDIITLSGLSRATVDRALNGRGNVHGRTQQVVDDAIRQIESGVDLAPGPGLTPPSASTPFDLVLRVGRGLMEQLAAVHATQPERFRFHDLNQRNEDELLAHVRELCRDPSRPLVLTAKNTEPLRAELMEARRRGKIVITFVSDLSPDARDAFVGIDNRMAGQTAAFILGTALRGRPARAGVVLGDYAFGCHEDREIGFRSNLRAHFPNVQVADVVKGEDSPQQTYAAVRALLRAHPEIDALYNVAGGNHGLALAVTEAGRAGDLLVVTHETNHVTTPLARAGVLHFLIAQRPSELIDRVLAVLATRGTGRGTEINLVDFGVYTKFNLPGE